MNLEASLNIGKSNESDPLSASTSTSNVVILDLDDCLQEVFKHLDLRDLCTAADVCRRFRQNAQSYFASPEFKDDILRIGSITLIIQTTQDMAEMKEVALIT